MRVEMRVLLKDDFKRCNKPVCDVLVLSVAGRYDDLDGEKADQDAVLARDFLCDKGYKVVPPKDEPIKRDEGNSPFFGFCIHLAEGQDCSQVNDALESRFADDIDITMRDG